MQNNKIGIIFCCYGTPEYIEPCLENWLKLKEKYNIKIAAVHGQFKEMNQLGIEDNDTITQNKLKELHKDKKLDYLYIQNDYEYIKNANLIYQTEAEIRDKGLQYLLKENVDFVLMLDSDETYTEQEIENLIEYINKEDNQFYTYFKVNFKNLTFTSNYYTKGFCPNRVWRVNSGDYRLSKVSYDNDCLYEHKITRENKSDKEFYNKSIPAHLVNPIHFSWLSDNRSRKKVEYQRKRWGENGCSFSWDYINNKLIWNKQFFISNGITEPILYNL